MKTFKDLKFKEHPSFGYGFDNQAKLEFANDYGISVINGRNAYCCNSTYEVAILYKGKITYNTEITDEVLTYQSKTDIDLVMKKVQEL